MSRLYAVVGLVVALGSLVAACARPPTQAPDAPDTIPADQIRHYTIWLGGARVGTAIETETWSRHGVALRRSEVLRFLRGDAPIVMTTTIEIAADRSLSPISASWTETGATTRRGSARRDARGWIVDLDSAPLRLPMVAVPAERAAIPTRVVTGLRVDGDRLIRHRWAASWTGRAWIAIDAAFGRVPAGGDLIGLAVHDADDAGLIAGEAALMHVRAAAWLP